MFEDQRKQRVDKIYQFIIAYVEQHNGVSPTFRELGELMGGLSTSMITYYLHILVERELIKKGKGSRNIQVLNSRWLRPDTPSFDVDQYEDLLWELCSVQDSVTHLVESGSSDFPSALEKAKVERKQLIAQLVEQISKLTALADVRGSDLLIQLRELVDDDSVDAALRRIVLKAIMDECKNGIMVTFQDDDGQGWNIDVYKEEGTSGAGKLIELEAMKQALLKESKFLIGSVTWLLALGPLAWNKFQEESAQNITDEMVSTIKVVGDIENGLWEPEEENIDTDGNASEGEQRAEGAARGSTRSAGCCEPVAE